MLIILTSDPLKADLCLYAAYTVAMSQKRPLHATISETDTETKNETIIETEMPPKK